MDGSELAVRKTVGEKEKPGTRKYVKCPLRLRHTLP
jgi:hypothetical protein